MPIANLTLFLREREPLQGQNPRVRQKNIRRCFAWQSGQWRLVLRVLWVLPE